MGYCYDQHHRLCCDICGKSGNVRKYKCPFGYCSPIAACPDCRKDAKNKHRFSKKAHREHGCEKHHNEYLALENKREQLLKAGKAVRCSALGKDNGKIHVLFEKVNPITQQRETVGFYMSKETYEHFGMLNPTTPEDYAKVGPLEQAPPSFY